MATHSYAIRYGYSSQLSTLKGELFSHLVTIVGLTASRDVIRGRDAERHKQTATLYEGIESMIRDVVSAQWIDTTDQSITETLEAVRRVVRW